MSGNYNTEEFSDELLADQTVCRSYANGRREWRTRAADTIVNWRDSSGANGYDELLDEGIIKRSFFNNQQPPVYGREQGYGRTLWSNNVLTVNRTSFGGAVGRTLAAVGGAALLGSLIAPPLALSAMQEEQMRQHAAQQRQQHNSGDGGGSGGDGGSDWDSGSDMSDGDFG